ncbi:hypothetical protein GIB67_036828 [Kingdonia uniflora]|uniref:Uncharacterized protein n=1 Tax=Kingdonia uniflora TaxID=39325 RepID=A0A7J7LWY5_9MAGN|nr:hypothetical protein GIB67_036828 [Kingdonia uniflora]
MADTTTSSNKKRVWSESDLESPETKRLRENLLDILEDSEPSESSTQDLDSVMKFFEQEISLLKPSSTTSLDTQPELGYLLEASDDELGLPPRDEETKGDDGVLPSVEFGLDQIWRFEDEIPSYEFEIVDDDGVLFDYSDVFYNWTPESLPAL